MKIFQFNRRMTLLVFAALLSMFFNTKAISQVLSDKPNIRLIVPFAAGTPTDVIARTLAIGLAKSLDRNVVVDNRPGAAGSIGTEAVVTAPADGQTLLLTVNSTVTINPLLYTKLRYDPMRDLAPIALVATGGYMLVANPQSGFQSVQDLIRVAKAKPASINYASYGTGSMSHMCAEVFQAMADVKLFHVPYRAGSLTDILGGQIPIGFEPVGPTIPHVQSKKLNGLAATASRRVEALPSIPSMNEVLRDYDCTAWVGILVPVRTPPELRSLLSEKILKIATTPEFSKQMRDIGLVAQSANEQQFSQLVRLDHEKWGKIVAPLNIKLD
jgi:tripartite-type tricarboxylate transporter receptor subunit TctC